MRRIALFASISALLLAMIPLAPVQAAARADRGAVPGSYIVVLNDGEPGSVAAEHSRRHNSSVSHVYRHALRGYAARMSERAAENVARDPRVAYVEADGVVTASQSDPTWGLDRIDQRALPLSQSYTTASTGSGVTAYVIDTGILRSHTEFGARATAAGFDTFGGTGDDCNGHGTHVAGTIGGSVYGVAKGVTLVPVRVLNCSGSGTWSGVIDGLNWVASNHTTGPAVANMSLGGGASSSVDAAVQGVINDGVTVVVAAGNGNRGGKEQDACGYSPARVADAITIGATTSSDAKTSWSNYGSCVDWFAPGSGITSAWYTSNTATNTISGTSMAAPHVAGTAALYLQGATGASPTTVRDYLYARTTKGVVTSSNTANNHLAYSGTDIDTGETVDPEPPANAAPTASFTFGCTELTCSFTDTSDDTDGTVSAWSWSFGDGTGSTTQSPTRTYATAGTYTVSLTVTDDDGTDSAPATRQVEVSTSEEPPPPPPDSTIALTVSGSKTKGTMTAVLAWSGAPTTTVDVYRDGSFVTTTANDGDHSDTIGKGGGSYTYRVCEAGSSTCSDEVAVSF